MCQTREKLLLPPVSIGGKNCGEGYHSYLSEVGDYGRILVEKVIARLCLLAKTKGQHCPHASHRFSQGGHSQLSHSVHFQRCFYFP